MTRKRVRLRWHTLHLKNTAWNAKFLHRISRNATAHYEMRCKKKEYKRVKLV